MPESGNLEDLPEISTLDGLEEQIALTNEHSHST
jgi:hypothetical protein